MGATDQQALSTPRPSSYLKMDQVKSFWSQWLNVAVDGSSSGVSFHRERLLDILVVAEAAILRQDVRGEVEKCSTLNEEWS